MVGVLIISGGNALVEEAAKYLGAARAVFVVHALASEESLAGLDTFDVIVCHSDTIDLPTLARIANARKAPVIIMADYLAEAERIDLLKAGAAFCVDASMSLRELAARVDRLAKRRADQSASHKSVRLGDWLVDLTGHRLINSSLKVEHLTATDFILLRLFVASEGRILSRPFLLQQLGKMEGEITTRSADVYVGRLRRRLRSIGADVAIKITSARNEGYRCTMLRTPSRQSPRPRGAE